MGASVHVADLLSTPSPEIMKEVSPPETSSHTELELESAETHVNIYSMSSSQLRDSLRQLNQPSYRVQQILEWIYVAGVTDFEEMSNLPKNLRSMLAERYSFGVLSLDTEQRAADGTIKRLYRLPDQQLIETVLMPYRDGRRTACISSQAGCAMRCAFCATGQMGFARHLSASEIFEQAQRFSSELQLQGERLSNIVLMGMGEPFHNYDNVLEAIELIRNRLGIGARRITVSTVGLAPKIRQFAETGLQVKLAISLHSTIDEQRGTIMPINRKYPIAELIDACRYYVEMTNRRVTFEWALIEGTNDSLEEAERLARLLKDLKCHVNVIPLNPTAGYDGSASSSDSVNQFISHLNTRGIAATVRVRRGIDIDAGCGQLKSKKVADQTQESAQSLQVSFPIQKPFRQPMVI